MRDAATLICIVFMLYLFLMDRKKSDRLSSALWIPLIWMFLAGSRYVSAWLDIGKPVQWVSADQISAVYNEGSPVDAAVFFLLMAAGAFVLFRRKIDWSSWLTENKWIWLYFIYCGVSIMWSDDPFVGFKRFVKELGNPIMALVLLTEERPYEAVGAILRRLAFVLLPLSVLFIRYYGDLGRSWHYDGSPMYTGIGTDKNALGAMCLLAGIYFCWNFLLNRKGDFRWRARGNITDLVLIGMVVYLIHMANSSTSLACLVAAVSLFFVGRMKSMAERPNRIIVLLVIVVSMFFVLDATIDLHDTIFQMLGRDATLTNRRAVWEVVARAAVDPFIGAGFMSFWVGERMESIWRQIGIAGVNQAHNGYLEQYLNLGYIGVGFIGALMLSGLVKVRRHLSVDYPSAMLRLCFIVDSALYNYTEASFYGVNNVWLLLILGVMEIPDQKISVHER
jgi:O-antigen ligase